MIAILGRWEIRTSPLKHVGHGRAAEYRIVRISRNDTHVESDLEATVGDFIARQVLERDFAIHEG